MLHIMSFLTREAMFEMTVRFKLQVFTPKHNAF